jgi:hypothetical protein
MPRVTVRLKGDSKSIQAYKWTIGDDKSAKTVLYVKGYTNFVTDLDYINRKHAIINGKINEWRTAQIDMLDRVEGDKVLGHIYDPDCYVNQRMWCHKNVSDIMLGISSMVKLLVDIFNLEALLTLVSGINTKQEADFVYRIASSEHFALVVEPIE